MTEDHAKAFAKTVERTQLDPFARQIFPVMRKSRGSMTMSIQTSIDGFRLIAQRSGEYEGQVGPEWCGEDEVWKDVWLLDTFPKAARVGVWRAGFRAPVWGTAVWDSYVQTRKDYDSGKIKPSGLWGKMPELMLAKCAEALALRKAFPQELSGLYTSDEMNNGESVEREAVPNVQTKGLPAPKQEAAPKPAVVVTPMTEDELVALYTFSTDIPDDVVESFRDLVKVAVAAGKVVDDMALFRTTAVACDVDPDKVSSWADFDPGCVNRAYQWLIRVEAAVTQAEELAEKEAEAHADEAMVASGEAQLGEPEPTAESGGE